MKRDSVRTTVQVRQADGSFEPVELVLHPPSSQVFRKLAERGVFERLSRTDKTDGEATLVFFEMLGGLLSRFDPEHGDADWLERNLEPEDIAQLVPVIGELFGLEAGKGEQPKGNGESP